MGIKTKFEGGLKTKFAGGGGGGGGGGINMCDP